MVNNAISVVGALRFSLLTLIWLICTTTGERAYNRTSEKFSTKVDHAALNTFIEDVLQAQDELADIRTLDISSAHKQQQATYPKDFRSTGTNVHSGFQESAFDKETSSFDNLDEHNKFEHTNNIDTQHVFHINNDPLLINIRDNAKLSQRGNNYYRKQSSRSNLDNNEDDEEMLKYLTSNFPKGNRLLQQGQMQEKQSFDTNRLNQIFSATRKNYFPNTVAVKHENNVENAGDQSNEEGDGRALLYEDLLHLNDKELEAGNEAAHMRPYENKQLGNIDALNDKALNEAEIRKQLTFISHLADSSRDSKDRRLRNEPTDQLENKLLGKNNNEGNYPRYASYLKDNGLEEKDEVQNEIRSTRYLKEKYDRDNVVNRPSYASRFEERHVDEKEVAGNTRSRGGKENGDDQMAEEFSNAPKTSDQDGDDPAVVKYFQTHGRRHNRNANADPFQGTLDGNNVNDLDSEVNGESRDEEKLKQAHERLQLEDADGLLVGMRARIGTTDNQMQKENVNQDKVAPKSDEEEDIQQQLEEEKIIFYPYAPGQTPPLSINADENNAFKDEREEKSNLSPGSRSFNSVSQVNSEELEHFREENGKTSEGLHVKNRKVKSCSGKNAKDAQENDIQFDDGNAQIKEDSNISEDYNMESLPRDSRDAVGKKVFSNSEYSEESISPIHRHAHKVNKKSPKVYPELVQNLVDESQEFYQSYNRRHLLHVEDAFNQRTNLKQDDTKQNSFSDTHSQSYKEETEKNNVDDSNENLSPSLSDVGQRSRRAVVKRPGAIWQEEDSNEEEEEGEEDEANREEAVIGSNELEAKAAKHVPQPIPNPYQTPILDSNIVVEPTAYSIRQDTVLPAKRQAEEANGNTRVNLKEEHESKRDIKNNAEMLNAEPKLTVLTKMQTSDNVNNDREVLSSDDVENKETHNLIRQVKRETDFHNELKMLENKYKNVKVQDTETLMKETLHHYEVGNNNSVKAKNKGISSREHPYQPNHLFDPSLHSDSQGIKTRSDEDGSGEYKDAEQDSYQDMNTKMSGTNVRSLLEKTSKDYEDVTKELKQVMKSLIKQDKSKKGFDRENVGDSYSVFESQNSMPLEIIKVRKPNLKAEYQSAENDHFSGGYPLQSTHTNLADHDEEEEKDSDFKLENERLELLKEKKDILDLFPDGNKENQLRENSNKKLDYFDETGVSFEPNSKRGFSEQYEGMEQPVANIHNYEFSKGYNVLKDVAVIPESPDQMYNPPFDGSSYRVEPPEASESQPSIMPFDTSKEIDDENLSTEMLNVDFKERPDNIAHEEMLLNDGYDSFDEVSLIDADYVDSRVKSHPQYLNVDVKKRSNNIEHARDIPQDLLYHSVSTKELDRLISEGNLPVLKRVKRSDSGSVSLDEHDEVSEVSEGAALNEQQEIASNIFYDNDVRKKETVRSKKSLEENKEAHMNDNQEESDNSHNAGEYEKAKRETKEKYNILKIRNDSSAANNEAKDINVASVADVRSSDGHDKEPAEMVDNDNHDVSQSEQDKAKSVGDVESQSVNKRDNLDEGHSNVPNTNSVNVANTHNQEHSDNSLNSVEYVNAKRETKEKDIVLKIRNDSSSASNEINIASVADIRSDNGHDQELVDDDAQSSQSEQDNSKSVSDLDSHFLNKRHVFDNGNSNVHNTNAINFANKHIISNKFSEGYMRHDQNLMHENNLERRRLGYAEKRRTADFNAVDDSPQHGKYGVNMRRDGYITAQDRKNDELDLHSMSKRVPHKRNKMEIGYKTKHHEEKAIHEMKPSEHGSLSALDSVAPLKNEMLYYHPPLNTPNQGYSKLRAIKPTSSYNNDNLLDLEPLSNDLPDFAKDDKSSSVHEAEIDKNANFLNTFSHLSPDVSQNQRMFASNDGSSIQNGEHDIQNTLFGNDNPGNAWNGNLPEYLNQAADADSKDSLSDGLMDHSANGKASPIMQFPPDGHQRADEDDLLRANNDHYSYQPDAGYNRESSRLLQSYELGNPAGNTDNSGDYVFDKKQRTNVNSRFSRPYNMPSFSGSETSRLHQDEYDVYPSASLRSKQPTRCVSKPSMWSQSGSPGPPEHQCKHCSPYGGELDDGVLGMNIVDTIINQVYGTKNLQKHIGPGLQRNFKPTKIDTKPQSCARSKMMGQISTIIDKGLEEEMRHKTCLRLPPSLQRFLDWLRLDKDKVEPCDQSAPCSQSQSNAHSTCDKTSSAEPTRSDLLKKAALLKKLTDEYNKLPDCEKSQVQNVYDILCMETSIVNKLLEEDSKKCGSKTSRNNSKHQYDNHASKGTSCRNSNSSEAAYNMPVFNYDEAMSSPTENSGELNMATNYIPLGDNACSNNSNQNYHMGENDMDSLISKDLEGVGLPQASTGAPHKCNGDEKLWFGLFDRDLDAVKNRMTFPQTYNSHGMLTKQQWMNEFQRARKRDDGDQRLHSYANTPTLDRKLFQGQMSNSYWSPEYRRNSFDSHPEGVVRSRQESNGYVRRNDDSPSKYEPNSRIRSNKMSRYTRNDQGNYYLNPYNNGRFQADEQPGVSNEYRRLLARAEQIRRKRSRRERSQDTSWQK